MATKQLLKKLLMKSEIFILQCHKQIEISFTLSAVLRCRGSVLRTDRMNRFDSLIIFTNTSALEHSFFPVRGESQAITSKYFHYSSWSFRQINQKDNICQYGSKMVH